MNNNGDVVGSTVVDTKGDSQIFLRRQGTTYPIALPSTLYSSAKPLGINGKDQIAAVLTQASGAAALPAIASWQATGVTWALLPAANPATPGSAVPAGINDQGIVTGNDGGLPVEWTPSSTGYVEKTISTSGGAFAIDNAGWVAGNNPYGAIAGSMAASILYGPGGANIGLGVPQPTQTDSAGCTDTTVETPRAMADRGFADGSTVVEAVGDILTSQQCGKNISRQDTPTLWQVQFNGTTFTRHLSPVTIQPPAGACPSPSTSTSGITTTTITCAQATGVNSSGWIVGARAGPGGTVYLWRNGQSVDVQTLLSLTAQAGWQIRSASGAPGPTVNDQNDILTTAVNTTGAYHSVMLVPAGPLVQSPTIFTSGFDDQPVGLVVYGTEQNQWSGGRTPANVLVEDSYTNSPPSALGINLAGSPSSYADKVYNQTYQQHDLTFAMVLADDLHIPSTSYLALASTETGSHSTKAGLVELTLGPTLQLTLTYFDGNGVQRYLWTSTVLHTHTGYKIGLNEVSGTGTGSLSLTVNGATAVSAQNLNLGPVGVGLFNLGNVYTPGSLTTGHVFFDDVVATTGSALPVAGQSVRHPQNRRSSRRHRRLERQWR
jgi:hypothetical protein